MRGRAVAGLLVASILLSGCTLVATSDSPVVLSHRAVKFGLLDPTIPNTNGARVRFVTQPVYVVDATGHLTASSRIVPSPPDLDSVLRQLDLGPTLIESSAGYTSALPRDLVILQATISSKGLGTIALAKPLSTLTPAEEVLAVGQLVFTAHAVGATRGIEVTVGGVPEALLLPDGHTRTRVTEADYQSLLNP
ncbi:MAG: GerMN domain-containing protein [Acidobacteriota bacterium]|nr:GerMN domain-containing protein [Acidobacteriota bacterium]